MREPVRHQAGFTLAGMLLIMTVISILIVLNISFSEQRMEQQTYEKMTMDIQQIANGALAYYVKNGAWPGTEWTVYTLNANNASALQPNYLNAAPMYGSAGVAYQHEWDSESAFPGTTTPIYNNFFWIYANVGTSTRGKALGKRIQTLFPISKAYENGDIWVAVPPPGQTVDNASGLNFAGVFHHGGCVPVPACPQDENGQAMSPQVFMTPVSVSGVSDSGSSSVYPISSFTAYSSSMSLAGAPPDACTSTDTAVACGTGTDTDSQAYWRACLQIVTEKGDVATTNTPTDTTAWGQYVSIAAFTRCASTSEDSGSGFDIYTH